MRYVMGDPALRAALFRFVDVRPACRDAADVATHLAAFLRTLERPPGGASLARRPRSRRAVGAIAAGGVRLIARRFILGETAAAALPALEALWHAGVASTLDLLGEVTHTEDEADRYTRRCLRTIDELAACAATWERRPLLERDAVGPLPRVNLSVKVSALTPHLRAEAPDRGVEGASERLRELLRRARDRDAHLHVDMESLDHRDAVTALTLRLLAEEEFRDGPSAGLVLQAYLTDASDRLDELLEWAAATPRRAPLTVRLVKGAYWDHEVVEARQYGWNVPVFEDRRACDRAYEALTRRLVEAFPLVRPAVASHNLRSVAHAMVCARAAGLDAADIEFQVLRGLGDDLQEALSDRGVRVRTYCPVGDLVAGMAYLVRRLLENTSNDSFLRARAQGQDLDALLEAP
jgi:proline dehydrogenase